MKIGFATADYSPEQLKAGVKDSSALGGAGWYRCELPARALRDRGHQAIVGRLIRKPNATSFGVRTLTGDDYYDLDVVVLQRWMNHDLAEDIMQARTQGQAVVNDLDDWFFGLDPANRAFQASHPKVEPDANINTYRRNLAASTLLICSTPYLQTRMASLLPRLPSMVCRNGIDLDRWKQPSDALRIEKPLIGWVGATGWRSGDLESLRGVIGPFLERHDLRFRHAGAHPQLLSARDLLGVPAERYEDRPMAPIDEYPALFDGIDIGLVPLRDAPFNQAKSCIKGMEYAAAGVPFIAQATSEYKHFGGATARRPRDWLRHLERLLDPAERSRLAERNLLRAWHMRMDVAVVAWEQALRQAIAAADRPTTLAVADLGEFDHKQMKEKVAWAP